ncbi:QueT transporter family protein [Streptococcus orisratti]|uniref:QueT transporter family protein n=1 Tax=Streptococcus orisratti TaxID=114652 RepID=UPI0023F72964|nr:QueT transporter family protein [Streptococcus orisratti]
MKQFTVRDFVQVALIAALYIVLTITPPLNAISYGAYQFRISEMLNFTAFYNRKYIVGLTLGCMISNFYSFGLVDVLVGGGSTLVFVTLGVILFDRYKKDYLFNGLFNKAFFYFSFFFAASMVTVAIELYFFGSPFWLTWFTTAVGELASLLIGALIMDKLGKRIDLTQ